VNLLYHVCHFEIDQFFVNFVFLIVLIRLLAKPSWNCSSMLIAEILFFLSGYTKEKSSIIVIGLNVHTAPVDVREKLAIQEAQWPQAIRELCALNHIEEAAVLSTCNRIEVYVVALSQHRGVKEVTEWMSKVLVCLFLCFLRILK